jgi:hypothetical protein
VARKPDWSGSPRISFIHTFRSNLRIAGCLFPLLQYIQVFSQSWLATPNLLVWCSLWYNGRLVTWPVVSFAFVKFVSVSLCLASPWTSQDSCLVVACRAVS